MRELRDITKRGIDSAKGIINSRAKKGTKLWVSNKPEIKKALRKLQKSKIEFFTEGYKSAKEGAQGKIGWERNEPKVKKIIGDFLRSIKGFINAGQNSVKEGVQGMIDRVAYNPGKLNQLQKLIRYQGGYYRELNRSKRAADCLMLGGESLAVLIISRHIPEYIQSAYEAAYPNVSAEMGLQEKLSELKGDQLLGLVSGIKGKLFEQQYAEYLNSGSLPDGYSAVLAESANQPGWDLRIEGPNSETVEILQAKATDSVGYVVGALEKNPSIDVVTTEEVYGHLVMSGVSEGIINSGISNASLESSLDSAVEASNIDMNFSPPWFTLALIAFTTYKDESLTLYQKARSAGDRSGKAYLSFLVGGALGAVTNTWWLGVVGTVASRYVADEGKRRRAIFEKMKDIAKANESIIERAEKLQAKGTTTFSA